MSKDNNLTATRTTFPVQGVEPTQRLRVRSAMAITDSPWGIGIETMDRQYVDFDHVQPHLSELGAKQARIQAGWGRCDRGPGTDPDFDWLDRIVAGCLAAGVRPWLQTSYGNPAYPDGGGIGLSQGVPTSEVALAAWDRWVQALAQRYADRVERWEIWNEADHKGAVTVEQYLDLFLRTASAIRGVQPQARIAALSLAGNLEFAEAWLRALAAADRLDLMDEITFHGYPHNPDDGFAKPERLREICREIGASHVRLCQGETGCPARQMEGISLALNGEVFNDRKQAVWILRRLLAHHARGYEMSLFQLADMVYEPRDGALYHGVNPKGLLEIEPSDKSVVRRRPAYAAAQHVFTLLDGSYPLKALAPESKASGIAAYAWQRTSNDAPLLIWWRCDAPPCLTNPEIGSIALPPHRYREPMLIDFLSGLVCPAPHGLADGDPAAWSSLPCWDSPLGLAEKSQLPLADIRLTLSP